MISKEQRLENLSKMAALTFITARAFSLWNKKLEAEARKLSQVHTMDTKFALKQIADGCAKAQKGIEHFEDWGI